jgi:hypothetical protein
MINHLVLLVSIISLATSLACLSTSRKHNKLGTVNLDALLHEQARVLATQYTNAKVPKQQLQGAANNLTSRLNDWACAHNTLLFRQDSVLAGKIPDYTSQFLEQRE